MCVALDIVSNIGFIKLCAFVRILGAFYLLSMPPKRNLPKVQNEVILDNLPFDISKLSDESRLIVSILMYTVNNAQEKFDDAMKVKDKNIKTLETKVSILENKIESMESKFDNNEAVERMNDIIITGPSTPTSRAGEVCGSVVRDLIRNTLRVNIAPNEIVKAHRIGKMPQGEDVTDKRSIFVQFISKDKKVEVFDAIKAIKPNGLYLNENLSPTRNSIMYVLRKVKKDFPDKVSGCRSIDGNVYVWVKPPNPSAHDARNARMQVNSFQKLDKFCNDVINSTVSNIIPNWEH